MSNGMFGYPNVPFGTGGISWYDSTVPSRGAQVSIILFGTGEIIPLYQPEGFNPKCLSHTTVLFDTGGTYWTLYQSEGFSPKCPSRTNVPFGTGETSCTVPTRGTQSQVSIVLFGTGGTSWDNPTVPIRVAQSQVCIRYHCTVWYR